MSTFGERLHDAMVIRGVDALALSRVCGVSKKAVLQWLAFDTPRMRATHLLDLAEFLNVRVRYLGRGLGDMLPLNSGESVTV